MGRQTTLKSSEVVLGSVELPSGDSCRVINGPELYRVELIDDGGVWQSYEWDYISDAKLCVGILVECGREVVSVVPPSSSGREIVPTAVARESPLLASWLYLDGLDGKPDRTRGERKDRTADKLSIRPGTVAEHASTTRVGLDSCGR